MDIDHEASKHKAPKSKVAGEARRTAEEDPSDQIQNVLDDAKENIAPGEEPTDAGSADKPSSSEKTEGSHT